MSYYKERCDALQETNYVQLTVSVIIVAGILISYLPQHHRIVSRGTSEGISPYYVLLGMTSATAGFANVLTVMPSRTDMACCKEVTTLQCFAGLLGIVQLGVQWICFTMILILFLVFFRYKAAAAPEEELSSVPPPSWQTAVMVGTLCFLHGLIVVVLTGVFIFNLPAYLNFWANTLGVMASGLAAIQYIPQLLTTFRLKHIGSFSIPMMLIQTPGGFLFAASLYGRLGWDGWSTWGIYLLTATMQGILLSLGIYYEARNNRNGQRVSDGETPPPAYDPGQNALPSAPVRRRPGLSSRAFSGSFDDGLPGPYTAHAERYADTLEEFEDLIAREEQQVANDEHRPLLPPGGLGTGRRGYAGAE